MYRFSITFVLFFCGFFIGAESSIAQTGVLRGGALVFSDGTNKITLKPPTTITTSYSWTLPNPSASLPMLKSSGAGVLSWAAVPAGLNGTGVLYLPGSPQNSATSGNYLFNVYNQSSNANKNYPGGYIYSVINGATNTSITGLTVNVSNSNASATSMSLTGIKSTATSVTSNNDHSTIRGFDVTVSGSGSTYGALFNGGNAGFGTSTPREVLEVNGNIRISGTNGLKITDGANATIGVATLVPNAGVSTVVVSTTKVGVNSRIFLMDQNGGANSGTPFVNARVAGTSFTIRSTNGADASDVAWWIVEPTSDNTYTSNTTVTVPANVSSITVNGAGGAGGGGGGGGKSANGTFRGAGGSGGGAGEYIAPISVTVSPGETLTITIGTLGSAGTAGATGGGNGGTGGNGGATTISGSVSGLIFSANGGSGGPGGGGANGANGTVGGTGAGGVITGGIPTGSASAGNTGAAAGAATTGTTANNVVGAGGVGPVDAGNTNSGGNGGNGGGAANNVAAAGAAGVAGSVGYVEIRY
jgi:hypothetical protein